MRTAFSGIITTILSVLGLILIAALGLSLYTILKTSIPAIELNESGLYTYLLIFRIPIYISAALLYVLTLLFIDLRIHQINKSLILLNHEMDLTGRPLLFIKSSKIIFDTSPESRKLVIKFNGEISPAIEIINSGKEPALDVRVKFSFDLNGSIKLIKSNDAFHLFSINENEDGIIVSSEKLGYSSNHTFFSLRSWQKSSFILPAAQTASFPRVIFPYIYLELFYWYNEITDGEKIKDFPELTCQVEYKRINGTIAKQMFRLKLESVNYSPGLRGDRLYESSSVYSTNISLI